jgi:hypothetical protein
LRTQFWSCTWEIGKKKQTTTVGAYLTTGRGAGGGYESMSAIAYTSGSKHECAYRVLSNGNVVRRANAYPSGSCFDMKV